MLSLICLFLIFHRNLNIESVLPFGSWNSFAIRMMFYFKEWVGRENALGLEEIIPDLLLTLQSALLISFNFSSDKWGQRI